MKWKILFCPYVHLFLFGTRTLDILSLSPSHTHSLFHTLSLSVKHPHSLSVTPVFSLSLSHTHTLYLNVPYTPTPFSQQRKLAHWPTHAHTHFILICWHTPLSAYFSISLTRICHSTKLISAVFVQFQTAINCNFNKGSMGNKYYFTIAASKFYLLQQILVTNGFDLKSWHLSVWSLIKAG